MKESHLYIVTSSLDQLFNWHTEILHYIQTITQIIGRKARIKNFRYKFNAFFQLPIKISKHQPQLSPQTLLKHKYDDTDWTNVLFLQNPWNLDPNMMVLGGGALERWLGHDSSGFMNGINVLPKRHPRELPCSFHHMGVTGRSSNLWTSNQVLPRHQICWHLDFGLPNLQIFEKFLVFISHTVYDFFPVIVAWMN